jgi:HrpA-like RNA helicase
LIEINIETPPNVIALPFYSKLDTEILEKIVKKIDKNEVRKIIRYPKNKYNITQINEIPTNELLPEGTYTRFIILATNIAEASITIDTFEYVIDIGNQKINIYDYNANQSKLEIIPIAIPNQKQRKGRVGRVKPGSVYYTYDKTKLSEKVIY